MVSDRACIVGLTPQSAGMNKPTNPGPAMPSHAAAFQQALQAENERRNRQLYRAANWITFISLALAFLPYGLGAVMWLAGGLVALVLLVLAVVLLVRGAFWNGLVTMVFALAVLPLLLFVAPLISVQIWGSLDDKRQAQAEERAEAAEAAASVPRQAPSQALNEELSEEHDAEGDDWTLRAKSPAEEQGLTYGPIVIYPAKAMNRGSWYVTIQRSGEQARWRGRRNARLVVDGEAVAVTVQHQVQKVSAGVEETLAVVADEALWKRVATAGEVLVDLGGVTVRMPKMTQRQMGLIYNRWLNSQP